MYTVFGATLSSDKTDMLGLLIFPSGYFMEDSNIAPFTVQMCDMRTNRNGTSQPTTVDLYSNQFSHTVRCVHTIKLY